MPPKKPPQITIVMDDETLERLRRTAATLERSVSWCGKKAIEEWLDNNSATSTAGK